MKSNTSMEKTFDTNYRVMYNQVDTGARLTIAALGDYILDTAGMHATILGISMQHLASMGMTWVMSGLKFRILGDLPIINSHVSIHTQVSSCTKISSKRDFVVSCDGQTVTEASTEWLIINTTTRRPVFLSEVFPQLGEIVMPDTGIPKYRHLRFDLGDTDESLTHKTAYTDIDINAHLYSMRYLQLALNTLGMEYMRTMQVEEIDATFISEVLHGQQVGLHTASLDDGATAVEMRHDGKPVFRARIMARPRENQAG